MYFNICDMNETNTMKIGWIIFCLTPQPSNPSATATDVRAATADDDLAGDATTAVSNLHRPICY